MQRYQSTEGVCICYVYLVILNAVGCWDKPWWIFWQYVYKVWLLWLLWFHVRAHFFAILPLQVLEK